MKIKYLSVLLCVAAVITFASCKSTKTEGNLDFDESQQTETQEKVSDSKADDSVNSTQNAELARKAAVEAGAEKYYPQQLSDIDKKYAEVQEKIKNDPSGNYSADLKDVTDRYNALAKASLAKQMKEKADELNLSSYDKAAYDKGEKALNDFAALPSDASSKDLLAKANEAFDAYSVVMQKGLVAIAGHERSLALEAKKQADSVKAGVAKKDEYKKASEAFKKADSDYVTKNIEGAYKGYKASKEAYTELFETVSRNRAAAQAAIERAKKAVTEAASYSSEADSIAPLTEKVDGIESEDAALLEEDKFANPEDAVINVEEGDTAKKAAQKAKEENK